MEFRLRPQGSMDFFFQNNNHQAAKKTKIEKIQSKTVVILNAFSILYCTSFDTKDTLTNPILIHCPSTCNDDVLFLSYSHLLEQKWNNVAKN